MLLNWNNINLENINLLKIANILIKNTNFEIYSLGKNIKFTLGMFHYCTNNEERDILSDTWNKSYNYEAPNSPYGFYFQNITLNELSRYLNNENGKIIKEMINKKYFNNTNISICEQLIYYATFIVLHEYAHYLKYASLNFDKISFAKYNFKQTNLLSTQEYRNLPSEKEADDYAFKNLKTSVEIVLKELGNLN